MRSSDFWMKYEFETPLQDDVDDPQLFVTSIYGKAFRLTKNEGRVIVGRVLAHWVRIGDAFDRGYPLEPIFDSLDQELADCYPEIFNLKSGTLDESLSPGGFFGNGLDLLMISKVEVLPKYRGKGLGLNLVRKTLQTFRGGKAAAILAPHPLRQSEGDSSWVKKMQFEELEKKAEEGVSKLRKHWGSLGFKRIRNTDFFILDLAFKIPKVSTEKRKK